MLDQEEFEATTGLVLSEPDVLDCSAITKDLFDPWRALIPGKANPERMNNPL